MSKVTQAFREHHQELERKLSAYVSGLVQGQTAADPQGFAAFLKNELLPHAAGEETALYPLMDEIVRAHGKPTATMSIDHEYIGNYITTIEATVAALAQTTPEAQGALNAKLAQLGLELGAIFEMHLAKEERIYLPLFEQYLSPDAQQRVLDRMHESEPEHVNPSLDVRTVPPAQRHPLIFSTFSALAPGSAFELVNDHDPKPLYYQFAAEHPNEFAWDYMEQGPQVWRVRIGKALANN